MVAPDVLSRRLLVLNEGLQNLARPDAGDAAALVRDPVLCAAVERWLQVAVEACIDIAYHVIASEGWTPADTARGAFLTLASHGWIDPELAKRLGGAAGLRNLLVHDYVAIDLELLAGVVRSDLVDLRAFATCAAGWMEAAGGAE